MMTMRYDKVVEPAPRKRSPTVYRHFNDLIHAYLDSLRGRASYNRMRLVSSQWIATLTETPGRAQILARHLDKGHGHFQPGCTQAKSELVLMRAACRWGLYRDRWQGGDPTAGIRKWKTAKRKRVCKFEELRTILQYFDEALTDMEIRDRALFGLQLFTGCRSGEARTARRDAITPYRDMGCWNKGRTKTGETQELPVPWQAMRWLADWKAVMPVTDSPYLFAGQTYQQPLTDHAVRLRWAAIRTQLGITGLWTYDLRRTLATYLSNELHQDDKTIQAILNHYDGRALSHYVHKTFDSLIPVIQQYADWVWALKTRALEENSVRMLGGSL